ncbi:MAG: hypothetical protein HYV26_24450 [Candidatus Hydrogenedentes bacterium]|nr:hypothetical protein [Candidatus Hydrogenedentota bacterium]
MKLFVLKLLSLLVLLAGIVSLALVFDLPQVSGPVDKVWAFFAGDGSGFNKELLLLGAVLTILGGYGLFPQLRDRSKRTITYQGDHGQINIQVDKAEATLRKVVCAMPEVRSVRVRVIPDKDQRGAVIKADVIVNNQDEVPARRTFEMITELIEETATDVLGLEIRQPVQLHITGTRVDAKAASQSLHARVSQRGAGTPAWSPAVAAAGATASAIPAAAHESTYAAVDEAAAEDYSEPAVEPFEVNIPPVATVPADTESPDIHQITLPKAEPIEPIEELAGPLDIRPGAHVSAESFEEEEYTLPPLTEDEDRPAASPESGDAEKRAGETL